MKKFFLCLVVGLSFWGGVLSAAAPDQIKIKIREPFIMDKGKLDTDITGSNGFEVVADYIRMIYLYGASILGIICVLVLVVSGIQMSFGGLSSEAVSQSKERIFQALLSLVLLFCSSLILKTINPGFFRVENKDARGAEISEPSAEETAVAKPVLGPDTPKTPTPQSRESLLYAIDPSLQPEPLLSDPAFVPHSLTKPILTPISPETSSQEIIFNLLNSSQLSSENYFQVFQLLEKIEAQELALTDNLWNQVSNYGSFKDLLFSLYSRGNQAPKVFPSALRPQVEAILKVFKIHNY